MTRSITFTHCWVLCPPLEMRYWLLDHITISPSLSWIWGKVSIFCSDLTLTLKAFQEDWKEEEEGEEEERRRRGGSSCFLNPPSVFHKDNYFCSISGCRAALLLHYPTLSTRWQYRNTLDELFLPWIRKPHFSISRLKQKKYLKALMAQTIDCNTNINLVKWKKIAVTKVFWFCLFRRDHQHSYCLVSFL